MVNFIKMNIFPFLLVAVVIPLQLGNGQTSPLASHVVHIGIDGLRPDCIQLAPGGAPNILTRLASEGSYTLYARTITRTVSAPAWAAILTAMPPELTGIKSNAWSPPWLDPPNTTYADSRLTPVTGNDVPFPTVFQVIEEQDPSVETAAFYSWDFFDYMTDTGYPGLLDHVVDCELVGFGDICDQNLTESMVSYLSEVLTSVDRSYSFLYLINVDSTGHLTSEGWCGTQWNQAVATVDAQVGSILDAIEESGRSDVLVMLTSDHGGKNNGHGRMQDEDIVIPVILKGPGIRQNYEMQYKVRNMDLVPTAVEMLGLEPSLWWEGDVLYEAFEDSLLK